MIDDELNSAFEKLSESELIPIIQELLNRTEKLSLKIPTVTRGEVEVPDLWQGFEDTAKQKVICEISRQFPSKGRIVNVTKSIETFNPERLIVVVLRQVFVTEQESLKRTLGFRNTTILDIDNLKSRIKKFPDLQQELLGMIDLLDESVSLSFTGDSKLPHHINFYQGKFASIAENREFYFQKAVFTLTYLQEYEKHLRLGGEKERLKKIPSKGHSIYEILQYYWNSRGNLTPKNFAPYLAEQLRDFSAFRETIDNLYQTINEFITYIDYNAWNKTIWNEYEDKRTLGRTGANQADLVSQFIEYAASGFVFEQGENRTIKKAVDYLTSPKDYFNIFSDWHQRKISNYFLGKELHGEAFHRELKQYFSNLGFIVQEEENRTLFYSRIIYSQEVRSLWDDDKDHRQDVEVTAGVDDSIPESYLPKVTSVFNDNANAPKDLLNVSREIDVFARLLAQKDTTPPLAIALFGNWGSGKSFFMNHLQLRIKELSASNTQKQDGNPFYCNEIVHISFNAWSYLDANLWVGFMASIFEKLNEYLTESTKSGIAKMKVLEKLKERLKTFKTEKNTEEEKQNELKALKKGYQIELENLEKTISNHFVRNIYRIIRDDFVLEKNYLLIEKDGHLRHIAEQLKLDELEKEAQPFISFIRNLNKARYLWQYLIVASISAGFLLVANKIDLTWVWNLGGVSPLLAYFSVDFGKLVYRYKRIKSFIQKFNKIVEHNDDLLKRVRNHQKLVEETGDQINEAEEKICQLDKKIKDFEHYIELEIYQETIKDFIQTRAEHKDYKEKLGIVSIIRRDLETLSELFYESEKSETRENEQRTKDQELIREQFKEGKKLERIILYIDDLDRCADDKVLEVLQAVHLLMAFPLFIVVVGVDKRCVTNALFNREVSKYFRLEDYQKNKEENTSGIHIINPDEYLEKIFQIPFQLQIPRSENIQNMIHELLEQDILDEAETGTPTVESRIDRTKSDSVVQKDETEFEDTSEPKEFGEHSVVANNPQTEITRTNSQPSAIEKSGVKPESLKISEQEREYIKRISPLIGSTPRTIKRFVNIYRLIRAHQDLQLLNDDKKFLIVIFVLAMHLGKYKDIADDLFYQMRENQKSNLRSLLNTMQGEDFKNIRLFLKSELQGLLVMESGDFVGHLSFIRRFSFNALDEPMPLIQK